MPIATDYENVFKACCCDSGKKMLVVMRSALGSESQDLCQPLAVGSWQVPSPLWASGFALDDYGNEPACQLHVVVATADQLCCYSCNEFSLVPPRT